MWIALFEHLDNQNSDARNKFLDFSSEIPVQDYSFRLRFWGKKPNSNQEEQRVWISNWISTRSRLWKFPIFEFQMQRSKIKFLQSFLIETILEEKKPVFIDKKESKYRHNSFLMALVEKCGLSRFRCETDNFSTELCSTSKTFSIETLVEEVKPVVFGRIWVRKLIWMNIKSTFWKFRTIKI